MARTRPHFPVPAVAGLLLAATLATSPSHAEVYKWTDAQGRVHFGDRPVDQQKGKEVELRDYKPGTDENVKQIYERNDRLRDAARQEQPATGKQPKAVRKPKDECDKARERLAKLSGPVVFRDADGKVVPTTEKQRAAEQRQTEAWIAENCR